VRHGQHRGRPVLQPDDRVQHVPQQLGGQRVRRERHATGQDRHRVADAPLELAGQPAGLGLTAALGRLTDQQAAVGAHEHQ
jgi:hypothetical protein